MTADDLYHQQILDYARAAVGAGLPEGAAYRARVDNPVCGDRVTIALDLADGRVAALGHEVRGCVLCQAAASVIAGRAPGETSAALRTVAAAAAAMMREGAAPPESWPELAAFLPVQAVKSRHDCVLLPFEALTRALPAER